MEESAHMWECPGTTVADAVVDNSVDIPRGKSSNMPGFFHPLPDRHPEKMGRGASDNTPPGTA